MANTDFLGSSTAILSARTWNFSVQSIWTYLMHIRHTFSQQLTLNQRRVNKSLAYEQFGYNLDSEKKESWSPDKLAVFFTRRLNLDPQSPFYRHIKIAPMNAESLFAEEALPDWQVSTACVVEGIAKLLSQAPKRDGDRLHKEPTNSRVRSVLTQGAAPLRSLYLENRDDRIYEIIEDYFSAVREKLWGGVSVKSYIKKTVGVQASFRCVRKHHTKCAGTGNANERIFSSGDGKMCED